MAHAPTTPSLTPTPLAPVTTLAVLAGGEGSRMGRPKGLLEVAGRPILRYLLDRLAWPGPTLLVTAPGREHPPEAEAFDREVSDPVAGEGPLRGLLTALEQASTETVVVAVVDMPGLERRQLDWLLARLAETPERAVLMTRRGEQIEPFPLVCRREKTLELVRGQLATRRRAVYALARGAQVAVVEAPIDWPEACWVNLNEPADLKTFDSTSPASPHGASMSQTPDPATNKSDKIPGKFKEFVARYPQLGQAHQQIAQAAEAAGPMDRKTIELVKIGLSIGMGLESAVRSHVRQALQHGASEAEVEQAALLAYNTCGWPRMVAAWSWVRQQIDRGV